MPGILPIDLANQLTGFFGNRIDFSNFARTSTTKGITSYSTRQVYDRLYIWGGIIAGAAGGWLLEDCLVDSDGYAPMALFIAAGVLGGFYFTHKQVMQTKLDLRDKLIKDGKQIKSDIREKLNELPERFEEEDKRFLESRVNELIELISQFSMSNQDRSNATLTLDRRKRGLQNLLTTINDWLLDEETDQKVVLDFLNQSDETLLNHLIKGEPVFLAETGSPHPGI
ncbi:hypothetical protein [Legionella spiritensis]|uniref:Transmembrane protein n=1 Tax=Legionella spiritensis TaxID=452 RepID=A0A0W0ZAT1_LEGSP|nr:hypothetical protein [Legionella spiritensis]KTD66241.1 hypothetical protein Lspi_0004 [Legionella spiritensis]SNV48291.1 Uncharacterised protein [Legionella spiritensis]